MTDMAWMIVTRECHMASAPGRPGYGASPSQTPQQRPRVFVDYAVQIGAATEVPSPSKDNAPADAGLKRARKSRRRA